MYVIMNSKLTIYWPKSENRQDGRGRVKIDKTTEDVDGNWKLLSGVIATDAAIVFNNRLAG